MIEKCIDEGTIQAFLDGELAREAVELVTRHIAMCDSCALAVAEAEEEVEFAFCELDREFNNLVPTERLWTKINQSIKSGAGNRSIWQSVLAFLTSPTAVGFASLIIVFGLFIGLYGLKNTSDKEPLAQISPPVLSESPIADVPVPGPEKSLIADRDSDADEEHSSRNAERAANFKVRNAIYERRSAAQTTENRTVENEVRDVAQPGDSLRAEESYVKTIATLEKTVNSRKDEVMLPAARFSYEKDIALADDTIKKLKDELRKNPNNEAARVLLRSSYQNKIDILNSLAEKSELMASLN